MKNEIIGIDVFCGCGGLTLGLRQAGINVVKGIDIDKTVEKTYTDNNPGTVFLNKDVKELSKKDLVDEIDRQKASLLLAGCAPCQPFSMQNRQQTMRDSRRSLMSSFARLVDEIVPEYVLVENVPGFMKESNVFHIEFIKVLKRHKYKYAEGILNAAEFGVPQKRKRYVLIASKASTISLPVGTYGNNGKAFKTVADAIKKYPRLQAGGSNRSVPNHVCRSLSPKNLERIALVSRNGGSRNQLPARLTLDCHKNHSGHSDVYGRMRWDMPAPTLTCKCTSFTNGRFGHPTQNRSISVREAAALQTFPDSYVFYGDITRISAHIGNAVPVLLAKKLGLVFKRQNG
jgi:DNA (cytosine-5)-methyltransferase 1